MRRRGVARGSLVAALAVAALPAAGCFDIDARSAEYGNLRVKGAVRDALNGATLAGAAVCVHFPVGNPPPCATSGADGRFDLYPVPAETDALLSVRKSGQEQVLQTVDADEDLDAALLTVSETAIRLLVLGAGGKDNMATGNLLLRALDANGKGVSGVSFAVNPPSGYMRYLDENLAPMQTGGNKTSSSGAAVVVNAAPGDYTVNFAGRECALAGLAWSGTGPGTARSRVERGMSTVTSFACK